MRNMMSGTKTTVAMGSLQFGVLALGIFFAVFGFINLFGMMTPVDRSNQRIDDAVNAAAALPATERVTTLNELKQNQARPTSKPASDGWSRLS